MDDSSITERSLLSATSWFDACGSGRRRTGASHTRGAGLYRCDAVWERGRTTAATKKEALLSQLDMLTFLAAARLIFVPTSVYTDNGASPILGVLFMSFKVQGVPISEHRGP